MIQKKLTVALLAIVAITHIASPIYAVELHSCLAPKGHIKASYADGVHGIVGRSGEYRGRDTVYQISDNALQCFCDPQGNGIQTNWINAKNMTSQQVKDYRVQGWEHVENGANWGLSNDPFVALNTNYSCIGGTGGGITGTGTGGAKYMFAPTGNVRMIVSLSLLGAFLIANGYVVKRKSAI